MGPFCWSLALPLLLGAVQDDLPANWKEKVSKDGGFTVTMPSPATEKKQQVKTATGQLNVVLLIAEGRNDAVFVVSYSDFPESELKKGSVEKRLDHARDGAGARARGHLRGETMIEGGGQPGREIVN